MIATGVGDIMRSEGPLRLDRLEDFRLYLF